MRLHIVTTKPLGGIGNHTFLQPELPNYILWEEEEGATEAEFA